MHLVALNEILKFMRLHVLLAQVQSTDELSEQNCWGANSLGLAAHFCHVVLSGWRWVAQLNSSQLKFLLCPRLAVVCCHDIKANTACLPSLRPALLLPYPVVHSSWGQVCSGASPGLKARTAAMGKKPKAAWIRPVCCPGCRAASWEESSFADPGTWCQGWRGATEGCLHDSVGMCKGAPTLATSSSDQHLYISGWDSFSQNLKKAVWRNICTSLW